MYPIQCFYLVWSIRLLSFGVGIIVLLPGLSEFLLVVVGLSLKSSSNLVQSISFMSFSSFVVYQKVSFVWLGFNELSCTVGRRTDDAMTLLIVCDWMAPGGFGGPGGPGGIGGPGGGGGRRPGPGGGGGAGAGGGGGPGAGGGGGGKEAPGPREPVGAGEEGRGGGPPDSLELRLELLDISLSLSFFRLLISVS